MHKSSRPYFDPCWHQNARHKWQTANKNLDLSWRYNLVEETKYTQEQKIVFCSDFFSLFSNARHDNEGFYDFLFVRSFSLFLLSPVRLSIFNSFFSLFSISFNFQRFVFLTLSFYSPLNVEYSNAILEKAYNLWAFFASGIGVVSPKFILRFPFFWLLKYFFCLNAISHPNVCQIGN